MKTRAVCLLFVLFTDWRWWRNAEIFQCWGKSGNKQWQKRDVFIEAGKKRQMDRERMWNSNKDRQKVEIEVRRIKDTPKNNTICPSQRHAHLYNSHTPISLSQRYTHLPLSRHTHPVSLRNAHLSYSDTPFYLTQKCPFLTQTCPLISCKDTPICSS